MLQHWQVSGYGGLTNPQLKYFSHEILNVNVKDELPGAWYLEAGEKVCNVNGIGESPISKN